MFSILSWALAGVAVVISVLGLGFFLLPPPFKLNEPSTQASNTVSIDDALPPPVIRYFEQISDALPQTDTAVAWGRGRVKNGIVWLPLRFKSYHDGYEMSRFTEVTWYSTPLLRTVDSYIDGAGILVGDGVAQLRDEGPMATQAEYTSIWAQLVTMPSVFLTTPGLRWEAIDELSSRLFLPLEGAEQDELVFQFTEAGLIDNISTMRYRIEEGIKVLWRVEFSNWKTIGGILMPTTHNFIWDDTGSYIVFEIEGVTHSIDPSGKMLKTLPEKG